MSDYWNGLLKHKEPKMISVHIQYHDMTERECKYWQFAYEGDYSDQDILGFVWEQWNAGSGHESKEFLKRKCRSMMVGDYVSVNGTWHECLSVGWRINVPWEEVYGDEPKKDFSDITEEDVKEALVKQLLGNN